MRALLLILIALLAGCGPVAAQTPVQGDQGGGSFSPDAVVRSFFDDLGAALKDSQLDDEKKRSAWVEQLANYFAPAERDDQRIALSNALESFVKGRGELQPNESLTLKLNYDGIQKVSETGDRALVRPVNGSIYVLITRTTDKGTFPIWEQNEPLDKIIGGQGGAIPVIRIGNSWFLSEG